jgi:hypothetical protein
VQIYFLKLCTLKIRRAVARHGNNDFQSLIIRTSEEVLPTNISNVAYNGYDSEGNNHILVREQLHAFSVILSRFEYIPIWRTYCKYG